LLKGCEGKVAVFEEELLNDRGINSAALWVL
jgi:hypothetical protein